MLRQPARPAALSLVACFVVLSFGPQALGQPQKPIEEMSLEELLNVKLTVAVKEGATLRESPGIVTLITAEEILGSGARDLIDVLRTVPGLDLGVDVQGVIGAGIRGLWGHEGKVLLLIDGVEMNEPLYSTLQLGHRFPLAQIQQIEIIRGPGSVLYGGNAELAVINIVTRSSDLDGWEVDAVFGAMEDAVARQQLGIAHGRSSPNGSFSIIGSISSGRRSDRTFTDFAGNSFDMEDDARLRNQHLNMAASWRGLSARLIVDRYLTTERDHFGENLPRRTSVDFESYLFDSAWQKTVGASITLTPRFQYRRFKPWRERDEFFHYDKTVDQLRLGTMAVWQPREGREITSGVELVRDHARVSGDTPVSAYFPNGRSSITYENYAAYSQGTFDTRAGKLTVGGRFENHSEFGSSFVPRASLTKTAGRLHVKLLASRAFRAPSIESIRLGTGIKPERTTVFEIEGGVKLSDTTILTANLFDIGIARTIVYFVNPVTAEEGYVNAGRTGSRGVELEYRLRERRGWATIGYAYYRARDNRVDSYSIPGHANTLLAFAPHKLTARAEVHITEPWTFSPSVIVYGTRYGYASADPEGNPVIHRFDPATLLNLYTEYALPNGHVSIGFGVYDLLGENFEIIQPYNSYHAPLPDTSREWVVRVRLH